MRYMYYIWILNILFYELCFEIGYKIYILIYYGLYWEKFIGFWRNDKKLIKFMREIELEE